MIENSGIVLSLLNHEGRNYLISWFLRNTKKINSIRNISFSTKLVLWRLYAMHSLAMRKIIIIGPFNVCHVLPYSTKFIHKRCVRERAPHVTQRKTKGLFCFKILLVLLPPLLSACRHRVRHKIINIHIENELSCYYVLLLLLTYSI